MLCLCGRRCLFLEDKQYRTSHRLNTVDCDVIIAAVRLALLPELVTRFMFVSAMASAADGLHLARIIEHKNNFPGLPRKWY